MLSGTTEQSNSVVDGATGKSAVIVHRPRKLKPPRAWQLSDLATVCGLMALLPLAWLLPERLWAPLCRAMVRIPLLTSLRAVKATARSIQAALPAPDRRRAESIVRDLKAAIHEMSWQDLRAWRPGGWRPAMTLEGENHLQAALTHGNGAILWLAPFVFNSGPTKIIFHQKGYRVSHLSSPKHGFSETRFGTNYLNRVRCVPEDRYLAQRIVFDRHAPSTAMRRMMRALKAKEIVTIVAASTEGTDMVEGLFLGGRLPVAVGAPRLAAMTEAPLLPVFTVRDPAIGFRIIVEAPLALASGQTSDERCIAAATEFLRRCEPHVQRYPEQWRAWSKWRQA